MRSIYLEDFPVLEYLVNQERSCPDIDPGKRSVEDEDKHPQQVLSTLGDF